MDIDVDDGALGKIADGELVERSAWLALRSNLLARLDKIARNDFPIPNLPPPPPPLQLPGHRPASPPLSPSLDHASQESDKDNASAAAQNPEQNVLPKQLDDMLNGIKRKMENFESHAPHTIQRLAELILKPRAHYKALASYLHAVDRVVQVTSGTNTYPLPPPIPDMSSMHQNGGDADPKDPASQVAWTNPTTTTTVAVGSDEALGGALLTPIPWLTRRSPEEAAQGAQIHSEGTQTIDGPNGVGSIETVSVSVNGVPSTGHARGVTQGELLRQEQRAGIVPVNQLSRMNNLFAESGRSSNNAEDEASRMDEDEKEEVPHARGPEEIGVGDTGPQPASTSLVGERGVEMQGIDLEAAVGRKHEQEAVGDKDSQSELDNASKSPSHAESTSSKREAGENLQDPTLKKVREDTEMKDDIDDESEDKAAAPSEKSSDTEKQQQQQQPEAKTKEDEEEEEEESNATPEEDKMEDEETP